MLKKAAVRYGLNTFTSIEFFLNLRLPDFLDIANEIQEAEKYGK